MEFSKGNNLISRIVKYKVVKIIDVDMNGLLQDKIFVEVELENEKGHISIEKLPFNNFIKANDLKVGDEIEYLETDDIKKAQEFISGLK